MSYANILAGHIAYEEAALRVAIEDDPRAAWNSAAYRVTAELARAAIRDSHFRKSWSREIKEEIFDTAQNRLLEELCRWIDGEPCDCGPRSFGYWVNRALDSARHNYVNRAKQLRRVYTDIETLPERVSKKSFHISRRQTFDEQDERALFDHSMKPSRHFVDFGAPLRGEPEVRSWRTHWFAGMKPPKGYKPKTDVEARKIAIAETPPDVRVTGGRR